VKREASEADSVLKYNQRNDRSLAQYNVKWNISMKLKWNTFWNKYSAVMSEEKKTRKINRALRRVGAKTRLWHGFAGKAPAAKPSGETAAASHHRRSWRSSASRKSACGRRALKMALAAKLSAGWQRKAAGSIGYRKTRQLAKWRHLGGKPRQKMRRNDTQ